MPHSLRQLLFGTQVLQPVTLLPSMLQPLPSATFTLLPLASRTVQQPKQSQPLGV